jgi:hypothetical protein
MSLRFFLLIITPPVLGVAIGYLSGGRLAGFRTLRIRALWLVWLAALVQCAQYSLAPVRHLGVSVLALVFALVLAWLAVNLRSWPRALRWAGALIVAGAALNGTAIFLNGRMPYDPAAVTAVGLRPGVETPKNEPAAGHTPLALLGDTIPVPGLRKVVSPGDVLIATGACALVVLTMRRRPVVTSRPVLQEV